MAKPRVVIGMSFLDVLCSAMGGAVILAVIFAEIKNPVQVPLAQEFILVEMIVDNEADENVGRMPGPGLRVRTPSGERIDLVPGITPPEILGAASGGGVDVYEAGHALDPEDPSAKRTIVHVVIRQPAAGRWQLQPIMVRWPRSTQADTNSWQRWFARLPGHPERVERPLQLQAIRAWTLDQQWDVPDASLGNPNGIPSPGQGSTPFTIEIGAP